MVQLLLRFILKIKLVSILKYYLTRVPILIILILIWQCFIYKFEYVFHLNSSRYVFDFNQSLRHYDSWFLIMTQSRCDKYPAESIRKRYCRFFRFVRQKKKEISSKRVDNVIIVQQSLLKNKNYKKCTSEILLLPLFH